MAVAPARAIADDRRWGFAAAPGRAPAAGVVETAPKSTNLSTQRDALPWGNRPMPPAPNAWVSSSLQSLKKGEGSGSFVNINDRSSSPGSSSTSTDESDLLDSPVACGRTSHDSSTAISHPESRVKIRTLEICTFSNFFLGCSESPIKDYCQKDDFPVLDSKKSQSNGQQGHCFQGRPSFSSVVIAARDEQRKIPLIGGDPVSTANFCWESERAQLHATQTPDICMPPPCIDYWHPPPDHPPDRNGSRLGGVVSYGLCEPADKTVSFPVESFAHDDQSVLNHGGEERYGPNGVCHPEHNDSCYAHVHVDTFVKSLPHLIHEKVNYNHSDALEKQPVIKKDVALLGKIKCLPHHVLGKVRGNHSDALEKQPVIEKNMALLEKIKCLNIKARNLRACNMPEISLCKEAMVECPKSLNLKADHVENDVPFSAATSYITSAFDMANSVSERSKHLFVGTSNMSAILVTTDLSEGNDTEFSEAKKMGNSVDNHVYGAVDTSTNLCDSSATDTVPNIWGHGWNEHSTVYALPVTTTNNHEDGQLLGEEREKSQQKAKSIEKLEFVQSQKSNDALGKSGDSHVYGGWNALINKLGCSEDIPFNISRHGWEGHPAVDSLAVMKISHQDQPLPWNISQLGDVVTDDILQSPRYEIELSRREISAQHPKELQEEERGKLQQKAKANEKLEELKSCLFVQNHMSNDVPQETNKNLCKQNAGSATKNTAASISSTQNVMCGAKKSYISMLEHIAQKTEAESHDSSARKHLQMEDRQRQVHPQERVVRDRSNIAESTKDIRTVSGTHVNVPNAEAKPHVDLSTQSKNRPVSPCVFGTGSTEKSGLLKAPVSDVVINSSIITMQAPLARGFTVGSIMLGDVSVASVNHEKTIAKEVDHDTENSCASPKHTKQLGKNQHDEQHAKDPRDGDSIMCTEVKEPSKKERPEAGGVNYMAIPAPNQPSGNQSTVLRDAVPAKTSEIEKHGHQPECIALHLQNPRQMLQAGELMTSSDNSSMSILKTKSHNKETLHTSTATQSGIKTEPEIQEDEKSSKHLGRSSAASDQGSTNGSAALASDLTEQEANSLVLKIMQQLSNQLEQVEKQLDSTHVVAVSLSEPTQTVSLPGYTWEEHRVSGSQMQYHVDGQGNVWSSYAANVCGFTQEASALSTAHVLPGPISVPENSTLNGSSAPVWTWDAAEGILTSDIGNVPVVGTAITNRSGSELTESIYGVTQMDPHCMQVIGSMSYEAVMANPEIQYHTGLAHKQVNPVWFPHGQPDVSYHSSSGTGVYWPQMDVGAAMQSHGVTGPAVAAGHPGYQLMPPQMDVGTAMRSHGVTGPVEGAGHSGYQLIPVASPGAAYTGSSMVSVGHPAAAWTWGAAYDEHMYYA